MPKSNPSKTKNQAINIAKLSWLNLNYPTFSNHLALPRAPYIHLTLPGAPYTQLALQGGIISNMLEFEKNPTSGGL